MKGKGKEGVGVLGVGLRRGSGTQWECYTDLIWLERAQFVNLRGITNGCGRLPRGGGARFITSH